MTTTIAPGAGHGVLWTGQGVGTTPGYSAIDDRRALIGPLQEGVVEAGSFEVVQRAAGANMSVDINANIGFAKVQGDSVTGQGLYTVPPHAAVINEAIGSNSSGNPRVDQVILEILDNEHDASGSNLARVRVLAGTATSGATLANRTGAAALPSNAIRLADVLVANAASSIPNSVIRDRRPWARGAYCRIVRTQNAAAGSDYTTSSTSMVEIDGTNLKPRIECSGAPLRVGLRGRGNVSTAGVMLFRLALDGSPAETSATDMFSGYSATTSVDPGLLSISWDVVPSAGSHQVSFMWRVSTGTGTLNASTGNPLQLVIEELCRQNSANNVTTSG